MISDALVQHNRANGSLRLADVPAVYMDTNPHAAHDAFWNAQGVQVVRAGDPHTPGRANLYLLLSADELVLADLRRLGRRVSRRRGKVVRVGIILAESRQIEEFVDATSGSQLAGIRRVYHNPEVASAHVLLTRDPNLAEKWRTSFSDRIARAEARTASGLRGLPEANIRGRIFDGCHADERTAFLHELLKHRGVVKTILPTLREHEDNVWIDNRATIKQGARMVGPLWVGPDGHIGSDDIIIGPAIVGTLPFTFQPTGRIRSRELIRYRRQNTAPVWSLIFRRAVDIAFSSAVLVALAPLFPIIMLAIWYEDGRPFFYSHTRQTAGGRNFVCYKFRTMCRNAQSIQTSLASRNICDGPQFHIEDDPRLLRTGKWLRRFHLDEIPQFVNVLLGQMHVVGPRPSPDSENQFCPAWREARLSVKAGITGLWQARRTRAANLDYQEWIRFDLEYVEQRSWKLDLKILFETVCSVFRQLRRRSSRKPRQQEQPTAAIPVLAQAHVTDEDAHSEADLRGPLPMVVADQTLLIPTEREELRSAA